MRFFEKVDNSKKKIILIVGLLSIIAVSLLIVFSIKLNLLSALTSHKKNSIDGTSIENDNNKLLSEQESDYIEEMENHKRDLDNRYKEIEQIALELNERQKALGLEDYQKNDLLYKYEPYYIYEGWNYVEMYTPKNNKEQYNGL
jgi:hypothetical protein